MHVHIWPLNIYNSKIMDSHLGENLFLSYFSLFKILSSSNKDQDITVSLCSPFLWIYFYFSKPIISLRKLHFWGTGFK